MAAVWVLCALLAGLNAGLLVSGALEGVYLRQVGVGAYLQMHQPRDALFRRMMPPLLLALMAGLLTLGVGAFGTPRSVLAFGAFALVLLDVLITVRILVPLNVRLQTWPATDPPAEARAVRHRWYAVHARRTALGVLAFLTVLIAGM